MRWIEACLDRIGSGTANGVLVVALMSLVALGSTGCSDDSSTGQTPEDDVSADGVNIEPDTIIEDTIPDPGPDETTPDVVPDVTPDTEPDLPSVEDVEVELLEPEGCAPDQCEIDEECYDNGTANPDNPCEVCSVATDPLVWTPDDAAECDDESACTTGDRCEDGACVGDAVVCDDADPCTDDSCDPDTGACVTTFNQAPCPNDDVCMESLCDGGGNCVATGEPKVCDDGNPCTDDSCDPAVGCVYAPNTEACDDGDACTEGDVCGDGKCAGTPLDCDDSDICTIDVCTQDDGCVHKSIADLCTDDNPCTDEACDPVDGCVYPFNTEPCDDGNLCTQNDTCDNGACKGAAVPVDDLNPCTDDSCDPSVGEVHTPNSDPCNDGDVCTLNDVCAGGTCTPGPGQLDCDDGNVCTDDSCDPVDGCQTTDNTDPCDDGTVCTDSDVCDAGSCAGTPIVCDDGNACTADSCDAVDGCESTLIVSNSCRPTITVTYPPRGATIAGDFADPVVTVTGTVSSGAGPITTFTINGTDVTVAGDGSFSYDMPANVGGNTIVFYAEDSFGSPRDRVQAFLWSESFSKPQVPKQAITDPGLAIWFAQEILDDGDKTPPPDDFASIFKLVLDDFDIAPLLGDTTEPIASQAGYDIYLTGVDFANTTVDLDAIDGGLHIDAAILNIDGSLNFDCTSWTCALLGGDSTGGMEVDSVAISADILLSVNPDHTLNVQVTNANTTITGVNIYSNNGWTNFLLSLVEGIIVDGLIGDLETELNTQLSNVLAPILVDALSALAFQFSIDLPRLDGSGDIAINLMTDFSSTDFQDPTPGPQGGALLQRAGAYTTTPQPAYDNLGIPDRLGCGSGTQNLVIPKGSPIELVLADDLLNQILYAAWNGGLLEFPVPASLLGGVDLSQYGISDLDMVLSGMLAPTAADCVDGELIAHIGDLRIDASLKLFGQQMDIIVWASFTAGLELSASSGEVGIAITDIKGVDTEVNVQQDNLVSSEAVIKQLIEEQLIGGLLDALGGDALGSIPLPEIDLSTSVGLPAGTAVIAIDPQSVSRQGGNTIVSGDLL